MDETKELEKINRKLDDEYINIVEPILNHPEFQRRLEYHHHENRSVYTHSLYVSYYSYLVAKKLKLDYKSTAIAGLLHDFYYDDWQLHPKKGIKNLHGFVHAKEAAVNSSIHFNELMNENTNLSIDDIDHLLDCFQEVAQRGYEKAEARRIVNETLGLDLYAEPDKAKAGGNNDR